MYVEKKEEKEKNNEQMYMVKPNYSYHRTLNAQSMLWIALLRWYSFHHRDRFNSSCKIFLDKIVFRSVNYNIEMFIKCLVGRVVLGSCQGNKSIIIRANNYTFSYIYKRLELKDKKDSIFKNSKTKKWTPKRQMCVL